jgi:hypothetical protein
VPRCATAPPPTLKRVGWLVAHPVGAPKVAHRNPETRLYAAAVEATAVSAAVKSPVHKTVGSYRGERSMADTLRSLAVRLSRLSPSHCDPERYHVEKSELVRLLARRLT